MRIAVFTNQFPSRVSTFFAHDMRGLIDAGIDIEIFSLRPAPPELWQFVPAALGERVLPRAKTHQAPLAGTFGPALRSLATGRAFLGPLAGATASAATFGPAPLAKTTYAALKACIWADRHRGRFDQVLSYWGNFPATAACLFHRLAAPAAPFTMFLHAGADLYRQRVFMSHKLRYADNIVVNCDFNRRFVVEAYPHLAAALAGKFHHHHPGIDLEALPFTTMRPAAPVVLGVGRLDPLKGFDLLLRAAAQLIGGGMPVKVVLVGDGPERPALRRLADRLGIAEHVDMRGWQPFDAVREAMSDAWVLVHPSPTLGDAVPTVIKESMALGTPVIGTAVAGIPELLDHGRCGVIVAPGSADRLAGAIRSLLSDAAARERLAHAARAFAERHFGFARNTERLAARLASLRRRAADQ
jgi:glycosyltransferase involved in cell wall biosynthesis